MSSELILVLSVLSPPERPAESEPDVKAARRLPPPPLLPPLNRALPPLREPLRASDPEPEMGLCTFRELVLPPLPAPEESEPEGVPTALERADELLSDPLREGKGGRWTIPVLLKSRGTESWSLSLIPAVLDVRDVWCSALTALGRRNAGFVYAVIKSLAPTELIGSGWRGSYSSLSRPLGKIRTLLSSSVLEVGKFVSFSGSCWTLPVVDIVVVVVTAVEKLLSPRSFSSSSGKILVLLGDVGEDKEDLFREWVGK